MPLLRDGKASPRDRKIARMLLASSPICFEWAAGELRFLLVEPDTPLWREKVREHALKHADRILRKARPDVLFGDNEFSEQDLTASGRRAQKNGAEEVEPLTKRYKPEDFYHRFW